jgi:hypothetical protein
MAPKIMNKFIVIGFLALASVVAAQTSVSSGVAFYAMPSIVLADPGDFDNAVGGAVAIGATISNVHSVEVDLVSFKTSPKGYSDDFKFMPILATYKYSFVLDRNISVMAGGSIGVTSIKLDYFTLPTYSMGGSGYSTHISETAFTSGLVGGISYALNSHVSLDANAHVLRVEKSDITTSGSMVLVTLGVKFRF